MHGRARQSRPAGGPERPDSQRYQVRPAEPNRLRVARQDLMKKTQQLLELESLLSRAIADCNGHIRDKSVPPPRPRLPRRRIEAKRRPWPSLATERGSHRGDPLRERARAHGPSMCFEYRRSPGYGHCLVVPEASAGAADRRSLPSCAGARRIWLALSASRSLSIGTAAYTPPPADAPADGLLRVGTDALAPLHSSAGCVARPSSSEVSSKRSRQRR